MYMGRPLEMLSEKKKNEGTLYQRTRWCRASWGLRIICRKRLKHLLQRYILSS